jgi:hypothetical protein
MTRLPLIFAFDYFRNAYLPRLRLLVELALGTAALVLIAAVVLGVIR